MNPTRPPAREQQQALEAHVRASDASGFLDILTGADLHDTLESLLPEHRQRLYPPSETLAMFLSQALASDRSCPRRSPPSREWRSAGTWSPATSSPATP